MTTRNQRTYNTSTVDNYNAIPAKLIATNAKGRKITAVDVSYHNLYQSIKDIAQYRVVVDAGSTAKKIFAAADGATVGAVLKFDNWSGSMVLLPHFDFEVDKFAARVDKQDVWTGEAIETSNALVGQLVAIDKLLRGSTERSPPPNWVAEVKRPNIVIAIEGTISDIDAQLKGLQQRRDEQSQSKADVLQYSHLLYENGNSLERAIEKALRLLGYAVGNLRVGDLEIDHVVISPSGKRMIGESEGKDTSPVDISKFRQLESNISEDFEREEIAEHAKGLLFGNGFRLTDPKERAEQFTQKCITNAKRLGAALIRTADLYRVAVYLLDNPRDEGFRVSCRSAIEEAMGTIVEFPLS